MIQTCLLDMGNVLVRFSHERMCAQIGQLCNKTAAEIRALLFDTGLQIDFECGRYSEHEFHAKMESLVGVPLELDALRRAGSDIFELNDGIPRLLEELQAANQRLVLLSNTSVSHINWVRDQFDVLDGFDALVLSYEVGAVKPDPAIFDAALEQIECPPEECFFTDDIAGNIEAARRFGLQAEVFTEVAKLRRDLSARGVQVAP